VVPSGRRPNRSSSADGPALRSRARDQTHRLRPPRPAVATPSTQRRA